MATIETTITQIRCQTGKTGKVYWLCITPDSAVTASVFQTGDACYRFRQADYLHWMLLMSSGDVLSWASNPISVTLVKHDSEQYWNFVHVEPRPEGAEPDQPHQINAEWWKATAQEICQILNSGELDVRVWDTETTGVDLDSEIISIGVVDVKNYNSVVRYPHFYQLIKPVNMAKVATTTEKTGIAAEILEHELSFLDYAEDLHVLLDLNTWVGWNLKFDVERLNLDCERHNVTAIIPAGIHDVMDLFAYYAGDWDVQKQAWKKSKLTDACVRMGIVLDNAHNALADALATLAVMQAIAEGKPVAAAI